MELMSPSRKGIAANLKTVIGLLALLVLLAVLQYHWLGQVSRAEQERMRATLRSAVNRFADDFDREIARSFVYFRLNPAASGTAEEAQLVERFRLWQEEAPYPDLVEDVFLARMDDEGRFEWRHLDPESRQFGPTDGVLASQLSRQVASSFDRPRGREPMPFVVIEGIPAVAIPTPFGPDDFPPEPPGAGERRGRPRPVMRPLRSLVLLRLDMSFIQEEWLPALTARYFHRGGDLDFELVVLRGADSNAIVFRSDPESVFRTGDASTKILGSVPFEEIRHLWIETGLGLEGFRRGPGPGPGFLPPQRPPRGFEEEVRNETGLWELVVRHRAGSLEAAVSALRLRNLVVSLGILALLAVSMVLILVSTERAQHLARQQMEFVAGVTHELQTPLAVIRSAGQNLADGVIETSGQVKEYGSLIANEGRRLSAMVDQVLEYAGLQSRGRPPERVPVNLDEIIDVALADCEPAISEGGIRAEKNIETDLPRLMADPAALRRALQNLIDNAVKYGGAGKWIGIEVRRGRDGAKSAVEISVADRGPGIAPVDLPHVFEPFYRGSLAQSGLAGLATARGNGLGLSLVKQIVESHGGRVTVRSSTAEGTIFTIHLPAE
jgi:signal transduction histidine kinase